ncbi:MAG: alpha/beta fold hydrolase [Actinoallomurus sp.]
MAIAIAGDGYRLWYEAMGDGPVILFPARFRAEFAALGAALADRYRIVRYKPRLVVGEMEPEEEAGGPWEPASFTRYPLETDVADLHTVADAAGVSDFVLAGYSGMAALAGFLAPSSERAAGVMIGGFPLLASCDYWLGFEEGARSALIQAGLPEKAADHHLGRLFYREWGGRDDRAALAALPGPKILWFGGRDCEPDCRMYDFVGGAAIARHIRAHAEELREVGFELIEFDGQDHIGALATTELVAPRLSAALAETGW